MGQGRKRSELKMKRRKSQNKKKEALKKRIAASKSKK